MLEIDIKHSMFTSEGKTYLEISAGIEAHELVCLFGHSGAGKTTLLRILAGLIKPDGGRIKFGDTVWFDSEKKVNIPPQKRNVGFMFQDYALFPNMSVEKNIRFAQKVKDPDAVESLLFLFGLETLRNQNSAQLSGGQRQRVALARALAAKPAILMLDEPLSALDIEMRLALQEEILKVHRMLDTITLLVSHDVGEAMNLASSVIYIKNGKVLSRGKPSDVFNQCISPENVRFLNSVKFSNLDFPAF